MSDTHDDREALPLLFSPPTPTSPTAGYSTVKPDSSTQRLDAPESRAIENGVVPETSTLGRTLSRQSAYILVISRVLGSGIFATPGTIIRAVGSVGLALSLWVVGAVVAACGLAIALEYGSMLPRSGGEKVYLEFTYRRPRFLASTVVAVMVVCLGFTASNCVVFSQYVLFAAGVEEPAEWIRKGVAVGLLTAITVIHGVFRALGVRIQNFLGWIKVGLIVFMILSGLYVVILRPTGSAPGVSTTHATSASGWDDIWRGSNWDWGVVSTSLFQVFYSYAGLENANNVLNEVKDPVRTLRFVSISALVTACVLYLLTNVAYFIVVPVEEIKASGELVAALFFERVFGGNVGGRLLPLAVALSAAGNVMVVAFAMVGDI
ncbi:putative methionine permease [Diaporthe ampelina]|uniref:Putative methionine permease n=1 Tax=Diaporthe ampelina TaxID=1214573 RepID=A0A0G2H6U2_9PEZI|nr:putative methionine permease [Diaporthe ampelina]